MVLSWSVTAGPWTLTPGRTSTSKTATRMGRSLPGDSGLAFAGFRAWLGPADRPATRPTAGQRHVKAKSKPAGADNYGSFLRFSLSASLGDSPRRNVPLGK